MPSATGIPPHVTHLSKINTMEVCCKDIKAAVLEFKAELRVPVSQAIDDKVEKRRDINASILDSQISELKKRLVHPHDQMGTVP